MPRKAARPCSYPGCPNLVRDGSYCPEHKRAKNRAYNAGRGTTTQQGYGWDWQQVRARFLAEHPTCARCGRPATIAHHIEPKASGGSDALSNLSPLCEHCHNRLHAEAGDRWKGR